MYDTIDGAYSVHTSCKEIRRCELSWAGTVRPISKLYQSANPPAAQGVGWREYPVVTCLSDT